MKLIEAKIIKHYQVRSGYRKLLAEAPDLVQQARAGQFIMVRCSTGADPLFRRPLTPCAYYPERGQLELFYRIAGRGTELLSIKAEGDSLDILGPLGNGYKLRPEAKTIAVVARGMGVVTVMAAVQAAIRQGKEVLAYIAGQTADLLLGAAELEGMGCKVELATDDGSSGYHGLASDLLARDVAAGRVQQIFIGGPTACGKYCRHCEAAEITARGKYGCGLLHLMSRVARIARQYQVPAQVSLEQYMACGAYACIGCARPIGPAGRKEYKKVCKDGPVFPLEHVVN